MVILGRLSPEIITAALIAIFFLPLRFATLATIFAVLASSLLLVVLAPGRAAYNFFSHKACVYIGLLSYSLYLWHWGVLSISRWSFGVNGLTEPFQFLIILFASLASYHLVETPLRRASWSSRRWKTIGYGLFLPVITAVLTLALSRWAAPDLFVGSFKGDDFKYVQGQLPCELLSTNPTENWKECLRRNDSTPHIFVLGDSHASNLIPSP